MRKTLLSLLVFLSLLICSCGAGSTLCFAQEPLKPEAPKPKTDHKVFLVGVSLLAASKTADAITTRQLLDRRGRELNPIFGSHPSPAKQAAVNLGFFAAESTVAYIAEHNKHAWVRWAGRAFVSHAIMNHVHAAACNAGIDTHSPVITHCGPF